MSIVFALSGFICVIAQTLLLRELFVVFNGNEISFAVVLSSWLLSAAVGSYYFSLTKMLKMFSAKDGLAVSFLLLAIYLIVSYFMAIGLRGFMGLLPGQGAALWQIFLWSLVILFPLGVLSGAQFAFGASLIDASKVYYLESIGYLAGGLAFTYYFIGYVEPLSAIYLLSSVCFIVSFLLLKTNKGIVLASIVFASFVLLAATNQKLIINNGLKNTYSAFETLKQKNTPYGRLALAAGSGQKVLYVNGIVARTLPDWDIQQQEFFSYLPALYCRNAESVLVVGGAGKYLKYLSAFGFKDLDYVELDPALTDMVLREVAFYGAKMYSAEARSFIEKNKQKYDLIISCADEPLTISLNRYFSKEYFGLLKDRLKENGVIALKLPGSETYLEDSLAVLTASVIKAVNSEFAFSELYEGGQAVIVASSNRLLTEEEVIKKFKNLKLESDFVTANYLAHRFSQDAKKIFSNGLAPETKINGDFQPVALKASLLRWQQIFSPKTSWIYIAIEKYSWLVWLIVLGCFVFGGIGPNSTAFGSGLSAMGIQMAALWVLQLSKGSIYHWIGLMSALFMAGSALGSLAWQKIALKFEGKKVILAAESFFVVWLAVCIIMLKAATIPWQYVFVVSGISGFILGFEFPILSRFGIAAKVYAYDVLGGWLATILVAAFIMPVWGIEKTLFFLLGIKALTLTGWLIKGKRKLSI